MADLCHHCGLRHCDTIGVIWARKQARVCRDTVVVTAVVVAEEVSLIWFWFCDESIVTRSTATRLQTFDTIRIDSSPYPCHTIHFERVNRHRSIYTVWSTPFDLPIDNRHQSINTEQSVRIVNRHNNVIDPCHTIHMDFPHSSNASPIPLLYYQRHPNCHTITYQIRDGIQSTWFPRATFRRSRYFVPDIQTESPSKHSYWTVVLRKMDEFSLLQ